MRQHKSKGDIDHDYNCRNLQKAGTTFFIRAVVKEGAFRASEMSTMRYVIHRCGHRWFPHIPKMKAGRMRVSYESWAGANGELFQLNLKNRTFS